MLIEASRQQVKCRRRTPYRRLRLQQPKHWSSMKRWRNLTLPWPSFILGMTGTDPARKEKQNVPSNSIRIGVLATSLTRKCSASPGVPRRQSQKVPGPSSSIALPNHQRTQWLPSSPCKTRRRGYPEVKKDGRTGFEFLDCASIFGNGLYREENVPRSHCRIQSGRKIVRRKFGTACTEWLCLGIVRRRGEGTGCTKGIKISRTPTLCSGIQSRSPLLCPGRAG